jgi:integral membrane sensor domain MASE1
MQHDVPHGMLGHSLRQQLVWGSCLALAYFLSARLGLALSMHPVGTAVIWPPAGLALAALLLSDQRTWPAQLGIICVANAVAHVSVGYPVPVSLGFALSHSLEGGLAAWLLKRHCGPAITLNNLSHVLGLVGARRHRQQYGHGVPHGDGDQSGV